MSLCVESITRLAGIDSTSARKQNEGPQSKQSMSVLGLIPVADLSLKARITSTVVFIEERQNLYIDTVSEAEGWAELLLRLDPDAWSSSLVSELETWTVDGIAHIFEILQDTVDGALSLTTKPEVFSLFTGVILAAKVLIVSCGIHQYSKRKDKEHVCVGLLEKLLELGRSTHFHDLLLYRVEEIVQGIRQSPESRSEVVAAVES